MELAIRGRLAIFYDRELKLNFTKDPLIIVEDNKIVGINSYEKLKQDLSGHDFIGDVNQLIIPGLVNCHTHLAMTIFRGIADDLPLDTWLRKHIWPLEDKLTADDVYKGTLLGAAESILSGATTLNSMYWFPSSEAKALEKAGLRGYIAAPIITGIATLEDAIEVVEKHHYTLQERIRVSLSLHSPYTVTKGDYQEAHAYLEDYNESNPDIPRLLIHTHLAESETEIKQSKQLYKKHKEEFPDITTPTELLDHYGVLDDKMIAAHCIHLTDKDIQLLKDNQVRVSLNPLSNAKLGNYMPRVPEMITEITNMGIGTDGPASNNTLDLFDTIRFLALYYKGNQHDPIVVKANEVFKLATIGGSKALDWDGIGTLETGSLADIITINLKKPHLTPSSIDDSILNHFAYSMKGNDVENVIADGKLIMQNREIQNINVEKAIMDVEGVTQRLLS